MKRSRILLCAAVFGALVAGGVWWVRIEEPPRLVLDAAEVVADAGAPITARRGETVNLDGSASRRTPIEFWLADGNAAWEDEIVCYREGRGFSTIGPLRHPGALRKKWAGYGWPSDLELVDGIVYGVDTWQRRMYMVHATTGHVSPLRFNKLWRELRSLAYDARDDVFYSVDTRTDQLVKARRSDGFLGLRIGRFEPVAKLPSDQVTGLVMEPTAHRLIAYDASTSALHWIDPATGSIERKLSLLPASEPAAGELYDELAWYGGELYAVWRFTREGVGCGQVRRVDRHTGATDDVGPVVPNVSAHSLLILGMPEKVTWTVESGPPGAQIDHPEQLVTGARFASPGRYVLRLTLAGPSGTQHDTVEAVIRVNP